MRAIWESVREQVRTSYTEAEKLQRRRDEELGRPAQPGAEGEVREDSRNYSINFHRPADQKRDQSFADAVEKRDPVEGRAASEV
jgi:hypothetical protein